MKIKKFRHLNQHFQIKVCLKQVRVDAPTHRPLGKFVSNNIRRTCIIINSKIVSGMFWNYVMQPGIFYPSFIHSFQPTLSTIPQPPMEPQISPQTAETSKTNEEGVLELTKQDLLEAGYDITKKPWSEEEDSLLRTLRDKKCLDWN